MAIVPEVTLNSGHQMPLIGFGTAAFPTADSNTVKQAMLCGIKNGYRHFDTAAAYYTENSLGEVIAEALEHGLTESRDELFITSKLWCSDAHQDRVIPALQKTLQNLQLEYIDLYLIHWPVSSPPGKYEFSIPTEELIPMDFESVWKAMEECQRLGLTKSIGVSNFSCKKIEQLLTTATIIPAVNEVEMNPLWRQNKLREFCKAKGIVVSGYSPLGAKGTPWGTNRVMENEVLKQIAQSKGKTHAQVCLRWGYEQGVCLVVKSFNEERMKENLKIFDWTLTDEETKQISQIPQSRGCDGEIFVSAEGPFKSVDDLWDEKM